ncbi:MAG: DUF2752 domain-containing protein [Myxococcales bacterium]|nr:DUF2752 domain-containing protein [Myxococcales bacterium]
MQAEVTGTAAPSAPSRSYKEWAVRILLWTFVVGPLLLSLVTDFVACPSARYFGQPCPGCGLTRATMAALHGHIGEAFHLHPLFFLAAPFHVGALVYGTYLLLAPPRLQPKQPSLFAWGKRIGQSYIVISVLLILLWIARMFGAFGGPVPVGAKAAHEWHESGQAL